MLSTFTGLSSDFQHSNKRRTLCQTFCLTLTKNPDTYHFIETKQELTTMQKPLLILAAFAVTAGAAYGGFLAGSAFTADHYQRVAISRGFGTLDEETLAFAWAESYAMKMPPHATGK